MMTRKLIVAVAISISFGACRDLIGSSARAQVIDPPVARKAVVRLRPSATIAAFNARFGTATDFAIASRNIYVVALPPSIPNDENFVASLENPPDPDVAWAELEYLADAPEGTARDFFFNVINTPQGFNSQPAWQIINLPAAHQVARGAGQTIAIVDTGLDAAHPAFVSAAITPGFNFMTNTLNTADIGNNTDDDSDGDIDEMTGHGTHVAGVLHRIAPDAALMPIRALDSDGNSDNTRIAAAIFFAIDNGATVINLSLGSTYKSKAVEQAVAEAVARGIVLVAASGNQGTFMPEEYPAFIEDVISVASVSDTDVRSGFSNFNPAMTLAAPGSGANSGGADAGIISTIPGGLYAAWRGTSMATPMAAGAAALLLGRHPEWGASASRVFHARAYLTSSAVNIDPMNPSFAGMLGTGRVDALAAVHARAAFDSLPGLMTGAQPQGVVIADFNGDGIADLATAAAGAASVSVMFGLGAGAFAEHVDYPCGSGPSKLVAADFNGDHKPDLAVTRPGNAAIAVLLNNGSGGFGTHTNITLAATPEGIAAAHLDGDQALDLVVAGGNADVVIVLHNNGNGAFALQTPISVRGRPNDITAADLDGDQDIDVVAVNRRDDNATVLRNDGGNLVVAGTYPTGVDPRFVASGDIDGDGDIDIIVANHNSNDVSILKNNGTGILVAGPTLPLLTDESPEGIAVGNVDCSGVPDVVIVSTANGFGRIGILLNDGAGGVASRIDLFVPGAAAAAAIGDVDGDGDPDIAGTSGITSEVSLFQNQTCALRVRGDLDCNGRFDNFDIDPFVLALVDPADWQAAYPGCDILNADIDNNGRFDNFDIDPFLALLVR